MDSPAPPPPVARTRSSTTAPRMRHLDRGSLLTLLARLKPDIIVHMAARPSTAPRGAARLHAPSQLHGHPEPPQRRPPEIKGSTPCVQQRTVRRRPTRRLPASGRSAATLTPYGVSKTSCETLGTSISPTMVASLPAAPLHPRGCGSPQPPYRTSPDKSPKSRKASSNRLCRWAASTPPATSSTYATASRNASNAGEGSGGKPSTSATRRPTLFRKSSTSLWRNPAWTWMLNRTLPCALPTNPAPRRQLPAPCPGWERHYTFRETLQTVYADWLTRTPD